MKSNLSWFFCILFFIGSQTLFPVPQLSAQQSSEFHTVQAGETLFSISRDFNITVGDLRRWNSLDSDNLSPGQRLRISPPPAQNQITHEVQPGETLFAISRRYRVTIAELQQWNNLRDNSLDTGRELTIFLPDDTEGAETLPPAQEEEEERVSIVRSSEVPAGNTYYTVRSGDTLFKIARDHEMTINELMELNSLDSDMLRVGQQLTVRETRTSAPSIAESAESSTPQGKFVQYRVESGEDKERVLNKFQMSETELMRLNPGLIIDEISSGQRLTVLLPPTRTFKNPYRKNASLEDLGNISAYRYSESDIASSTTSGELYNPEELTAAHPNMALGNVIFVENPSNGNSIFVRINDRHSGDGLKLSHKAFSMLGFSSVEQATVSIYLDN
jgi:LysM repeat protein